MGFFDKLLNLLCMPGTEDLPPLSVLLIIIVAALIVSGLFMFGSFMCGLFYNMSHRRRMRAKDHDRLPPTKVDVQSGDQHYHRDTSGVLHRCYHKCKVTVASPAFWIGVTLSFPLEHGLYTYVWPFTIVGKLFGMEAH